MSAGNPNNDAYIGSPDSVYETSANPARIIGSVAYDPNAPLPGTIPPIGADGSAMPATLTPDRPRPGKYFRPRLTVACRRNITNKLFNRYWLYWLYG